jgi:hypothetical protein
MGHAWFPCFCSRQNVEQFYQARLIGIAHLGPAIQLYPFGVLDPQIVVNLFSELGLLLKVDGSKFARTEKTS